MADVTAPRPITRWVGRGLPGWATLGVRHPATGRMAIAAAGFGLVADQALRAGGFGAAASLSLTAAAVLLVTLGRIDRRQPRLLAGAAAVFAAALSLRASPWLAWPDLAASILLLGAAASLGARGSLSDLGLAEAGARIVHGLLHLGAGGAYAAPPLARARGMAAMLAPIARGLAIAIPIAVVLAALLAVADPIFASFLNLNLDYGSLAVDAVLVSLGALALAGLLRLAAAAPMPIVEAPRWRLGLVEGLTVMAVLDAVFAAFAVAQAIAVSSTDYSAYARSGFFQLLWAAGITLVTMLVFSRITAFSSRRGRVAFIILAELAIALTLLVVAVAFHRLSLYEEAYGFTMLRLYSHLFACWVGVVFLFLAIELAGGRRERRWFAGAASGAGLALLLALNVASPEALVVHLNIDRAAATGKLDVDYVTQQLSGDAVPALLVERGRLDPGLRRDVERAVCQAPARGPGGWSAWNLALASSDTARRTSCPPSGP